MTATRDHVHETFDVVFTSYGVLLWLPDLRPWAEVVARSHDLRETLNNVIDLVAKRLDADVCSIYLTDADLRTLTLSATIGLDAVVDGFRPGRTSRA